MRDIFDCTFYFVIEDFCEPSTFGATFRGGPCPCLYPIMGQKSLDGRPKNQTSFVCLEQNNNESLQATVKHGGGPLIIRDCISTNGEGVFLFLLVYTENDSFVLKHQL